MFPAYIDTYNNLLPALGETITLGPKYDDYQVYVAGHSLGGAAANQLRDIASSAYGGVYADAKFVTFDCPVIADAQSNVFNFGHENDWVYKALDRLIVPKTGFPFNHVELNFPLSTDNIVRFDDAYKRPNLQFDPKFDVTSHERETIYVRVKNNGIFFLSMDK